MMMTATKLYNLKEGSLPKRFDEPNTQKGFGTGIQPNLLYQTSSSTYGSRQPHVQDMPVSYRPRSQKFSQHIQKLVVCFRS